MERLPWEEPNFGKQKGEKRDLRQLWGKYCLNETVKKKVKSKVDRYHVKY